MCPLIGFTSRSWGPPLIACGTVKADPGTLDPKNRVVEERNRVVNILAEEKGLALNDLYTPLLGRPELRSADGYHYLEEGYRLIGGEIARFLV